MHRLLLLGLLLALAGCSTDPVMDCNLTLVAQAPLMQRGGLLVTRAGINERWVDLIVDTGAERTTLSDRAAKRLAFKEDPTRRMSSGGVGGTSTHADVIVDRFYFGGRNLRELQRVAVGTLILDTPSGTLADGLLGADVLLGFELDIDVPNGTLTLYRPRTCPGAKPSWAEQSVEVIGGSARRDRMLIPFTLDGVAGTAILDTGASTSVIGMQMARRMGLTEQGPARDPTVQHHGAGPGTATAHLHTFQQLRVGPAVMTYPRLSVMPGDVGGIGDALIGQDFLVNRRVWFSFPTRQLFVSSLSNEARSGR